MERPLGDDGQVARGTIRRKIDIMRIVLTLPLLVLALALPSAGEAGLAGKCRKACKPQIAECVAAGLKRAKCRKMVIGECKRTSLDACAATVTTTTISEAPTTTSTTLPSGPGFFGFGNDDLVIDDSTDPGTLRFQVYLNPDERTKPVDLDPSYFSIREADGTRWNAEAASEAEDCSAQLVTTPGTELWCWVTFRVPNTVGREPAEGERSGAAVWFEAGGYARKASFTIRDGGFTLGW
jgi:hypothetical protein